jgi:hypothetical protein
VDTPSRTGLLGCDLSSKTFLIRLIIESTFHWICRKPEILQKRNRKKQEFLCRDFFGETSATADGEGDEVAMGDEGEGGARGGDRRALWVRGMLGSF